MRCSTKRRNFRNPIASYALGRPNVERELHDLRRFLPANTAIIVGGRAAEFYHAAIDATGAISLRTLPSFRSSSLNPAMKTSSFKKKPGQGSLSVPRTT